MRSEKLRDLKEPKGMMTALRFSVTRTNTSYLLHSPFFTYPSLIFSCLWMALLLSIRISVISPSESPPTSSMTQMQCTFICSSIRNNSQEATNWLRVGHLPSFGLNHVRLENAAIPLGMCSPLWMQGRVPQKESLQNYLVISGENKFSKEGGTTLDKHYHVHHGY